MEHGLERNLVNTSFIWNIRPSDDEHATWSHGGRGFCIGSLLFDAFRSRTTIHLCLFEEEQENLGWAVSSKIWYKFIMGLVYGSDLILSMRHTMKSLRWSPIFKNAGSDLYPLESGDRQKLDRLQIRPRMGRWLFPHPDGSRAAFEHMRKTTFEDDYHRLMPHFEEHPELIETFSDLI